MSKGDSVGFRRRFAPFATQVAANTLGTLIAAAIIYLFGAAAGIFTAHPWAITLAVIITVFGAFDVWVFYESVKDLREAQRFRAERLAAEVRTRSKREQG